MANLNVAEWSPDQVAEWLSGLGPTVARYVPGLLERGLNGHKLLMLRCDDLEYLGIYIIGHQELILEAVEHLRHFQYEWRRECVQQLAMRVSVAATGLARSLAPATSRLRTQALADVAATVRAIKPLVCWLHRWVSEGGWCGAPGAGSWRARLLQLALEAATCAQRDRFADQPAAAVAAAAAAAAHLADYILKEVCDPLVLAPAGLEAAQLRQGARPLGFGVEPSFCGHVQLASIRFGSPAHASGLVRDGDEIVQVGGRCVVGWSGEAVLAECERAAAGGELMLRLRRRAPRPARPHLRRARARDSIKSSVASMAPARLVPPAGSSSDESEPLSPPASPSHLRLPHASRLYGPKPRSLLQRRHSVSGGSPQPRRTLLPPDQFWREVESQRRLEPDDTALYRRDKAVSCSTGLELSPRPRTCPPGAGPGAGPGAAPAVSGRGRLDKSQSTPAYESDEDPPPAPRPLPIPESPTTTPANSPTILVHSAEKADQILSFKKSSCQLGQALRTRRHDDPEPRPADPPPDHAAQQAGRVVESVNVALLEQRRRSLRARLQPPSPPSPPPRAPLARPPSPPPAPPKPARPLHHSQMSLPVWPISKQDIRVLPERRELPPINAEVEPPPAPAPAAAAAPAPAAATLSPSVAGVKTIFPTSKSKTLKKKNSLLAKRREVCAREVSVGAAAAGAVWQRVRARSHTRWARRHLLLAHDTLYAYRTPECGRAACMIYLAGFTASAAGEVRSRAHAFKVYHTGTAFYFAAPSPADVAAWLALLARATLPAPQDIDISKQVSETDYSDTESDTESPEKRSEKEREKETLRERERREEKEKDKSKFGSLKKLAGRVQRSESAENVSHTSAASLDRKYLRFFSRHRSKDDSKAVTKPKPAVPAEQYRSYRRVPLSPASLSPSPLSPVSPLSASLPSPVSAVSVAPGRAPLTLEQFMLRRQRDERRAPSLQRRLDRIVPDVIYGHLPQQQSRSLPQAPVIEPATTSSSSTSKPISVRGKDGYEQLVYPEDAEGEGEGAPDGWKDSLRRNHKVHSRAAPRRGPTDSWGSGEAGPRAQYPHLQCPPTFQPETYCLARLAPPDL